MTKLFVYMEYIYTLEKFWGQYISRKVLIYAFNIIIIIIIIIIITAMFSYSMEASCNCSCPQKRQKHLC
jgi:hypothetical protein